MRFRVDAITDGPFRSVNRARDFSVQIHTFPGSARSFEGTGSYDLEVMWSWTRKSGTPRVGGLYTVSNRVAEAMLNA